MQCDEQAPCSTSYCLFKSMCLIGPYIGTDSHCCGAAVAAQFNGNARLLNEALRSRYGVTLDSSPEEWAAAAGASASAHVCRAERPRAVPSSTHRRAGSYFESLPFVHVLSAAAGVGRASEQTARLERQQLRGTGTKAEGSATQERDAVSSLLRFTFSHSQ